MKFDKIDLNILSILQKDGRITKSKLAEQVNLSNSACHGRLARIEDSRIISNYRAEVDIQRLVHTDIVVVQVVLRNHRYEDFQIFERYIQNVPQIVECLSVTGGYDYLLKFAVNSMDHFQELFENLLCARVGIERYFTYVVVKKVVPFSGFPILALTEHAQNNAGKENILLAS